MHRTSTSDRAAGGTWHVGLALSLALVAGCGGGAATESQVCTPACPGGTVCGQSGCVAIAGDASVRPDAAADLALPCGGCAAPTPYCGAGDQCVACLMDSHCPTGSVCRAIGSGRACVPGCSDDSRCTGSGVHCCDGACTETASSALHCGACGHPCAPAHATAACVAGQCAAPACAPGWGDCNHDPADGCEANLLVDVANCTACGRACTANNAIAACGGGCYLAACSYGFQDCNGSAADGCEVNVIADASNCGGCGVTCPPEAHAQVGCVVGRCGLVGCSPGYADCDGDPNNGCEINTTTDLKNCGACGARCDGGLICKNGGCTCARCDLPNARAACINQACAVASCLPGFADCDKVAQNGCEVNLLASAANCGSCGFACGGQTPFCQGGVCAKVATSCQSIKLASPNAKSGTYTIDPDGQGPMVVWCEMSADGGGWTLALRAQSKDSTYKDFFNPLWTDGHLLNEGVNIDDTTDGDAKYGSYTRLAGTEIRGCLLDVNKNSFGCKHYSYANNPQTLKDLFLTTPVGSDLAGKGLFFDENDPESWLTMWGHSYADSSCNPPGYHRVGINIDDDQSCYRARVRFGLALNNENNIVTLNDTAGFGASAYCDMNVCDNVTESCWRVGAGFQAADRTYGTVGTMWVR